jgi:ankyrin repeat protein
MLGIACGENHAALVDELLARGANPDLPSTRFGVRQTPLMIAASCDYPGLVRKLLAAGADRTIAIDGKRAIDVATGRRADEVQALLR